MYEFDIAVNEQKKKELYSVFKFAVYIILLSLFIYFTDFKAVYYGSYIALFAFCIKLSGIYLFFTPRRRYGTVRAINGFKENVLPKVSGTGGVHGSGVVYVMDCTVTVEFDNGKQKDYFFTYQGELKTLKLGDRIGIFRFLKMPVMEG